MMIAFAPEAWDDFRYWLETDTRQSKKITRLIEIITRDPFNGIGQPEQLKNELTGYWSGRINSEHRLVYKVVDELLIIKQCRYHYQK